MEEEYEDEIETCDQCEKDVDLTKPHFKLVEQQEIEHEDDVEILDSDDIAIFCSKECLTKFKSED